MARAPAKKMPIQASRKSVSGSRRRRPAVAAGAGTGAGEEDADPGEQEKRLRLAPSSPRDRRGAGHERGEDDPPRMDEQHQRVLQFMPDRLERVSGKEIGRASGRE